MDCNTAYHEAKQAEVPGFVVRQTPSQHCRGDQTRANCKNLFPHHGEPSDCRRAYPFRVLGASGPHSFG